ncbi:uncharacterized protein LOC134177148 [Corticium candelabrum]|uniref:uncharacterized protein LOC134177148 n=1 Tax=Corticium candelabrum TaxID=121492 RepID=UPI002E268C29|nr:uncharacterized protein LOC134177148 [Corticium candelabrum]
MVNSTKSNLGSGPGPSYVCYEWIPIFGTRRDVELRINLCIPPDMLLQVNKYSGSTEELIGEAMNSSCDRFAIGIANCTGFSVRLVGETCEGSKLPSTFVTTFYYSTKMVSESPLDGCQRSSCGKASFFSLSNIHTMGYRCYCKDYDGSCVGSCVPAFQGATNITNACNCPPPPIEFLGEICYLGGHHNIIQLDSPKTTCPSNASSNKNEKKNVGVVAGAGTLSCFAVILLVLAVYFFYRRKRLNAVEGEYDCDTVERELDEQEKTRRAVDYEVPSTSYLPNVLTLNSGYGKSPVVDSPAYNVAVNTN